MAGNRVICPGFGGFGGFGGIRADRNGLQGGHTGRSEPSFRLLAPIAGGGALPEACFSPVFRWDQAWPGVLWTSLVES